MATHNGVDVDEERKFLIAIVYWLWHEMEPLTTLSNRFPFENSLLRLGLTKEINKFQRQETFSALDASPECAV